LTPSEGTDDGQMTPCGYPNFNSYVKNYVHCIAEEQTNGQTDRAINQGGGLANQLVPPGKTTRLIIPVPCICKHEFCTLEGVEVEGIQGAGLLPPLNHLTMAIIIPLLFLPLSSRNLIISYIN
jgi:hypothetical protein